MTQLSTMPSTAEQARHALLLIGVPASARLVVDVHAALFDGDLSMAGMAGLLRDRVPGFCAALTVPQLAPARGLIALSDWSLDRRMVTPAGRRAAHLAAVVRIGEFVAMRPTAGRGADRLLRELAEGVPGGTESLDLADAARTALRADRLVAELAAEQAERAEAVARAAELDADQQLYGLPVVPHQRDGV